MAKDNGFIDLGKDISKGSIVSSEAELPKAAEGETDE